MAVRIAGNRTVPIRARLGACNAISRETHGVALSAIVSEEHVLAADTAQDPKTGDGVRSEGGEAPAPRVGPPERRARGA